MDKIKIAVSYIFYPMAMGHWFLRALKRRDDVEVWTVGPFTGTEIPWNYGMVLPEKYVITPDFPLPKQMIGARPDPKVLNTVMPWKPDLFLIIDAGWYFLSRPNAEIVCHIQTDPHVLKHTYNIPKSYSDFKFCMQGNYMENGEIYLPYGYDPVTYFPEELEKKFDACLVGLHYPQRDALVKGIQSQGYKVHYSIGEIYDDNRMLYNQSKLALSWSSLEDLPARVWEGMGMGLPVLTNRVSDLNHFFVEGEDYIGFGDLREGIGKARWALENYDTALEIAHSAYRKVKAFHTWDMRLNFLLREVGLV